MSPYHCPRSPITWQQLHPPQMPAPGWDWWAVFKRAAHGLRRGHMDAFASAREEVTWERATRVSCECRRWASHDILDRRFNGHHRWCHHGKGQW